MTFPVISATALIIMCCIAVLLHFIEAKTKTGANPVFIAIDIALHALAVLGALMWQDTLEYCLIFLMVSVSSSLFFRNKEIKK